MPNIVSFSWYGERVKNVTIDAVKKGIDQVTILCVSTAKADTPVITSALHGSIQMRPAVRSGNSVMGQWGSWSINYAASVEYGSKPHRIYPKVKKALFWPGALHPVPYVNHPGYKGKHMLENAAKKHYPKLVSFIRSNMK